MLYYFSNTVHIINDRCYFFYPEIILTNPEPYPHIYVHVQPRTHDSANANIAKFIRENKSAEGKSVEFLDFGVLERSHHFCAKYIR